MSSIITIHIDFAKHIAIISISHYKSSVPRARAPAQRRVDLAQQMMFFAGSEVNDPCTLLSYTIMNASTLHMAARYDLVLTEVDLVGKKDKCSNRRVETHRD